MVPSSIWARIIPESLWEINFVVLLLILDCTCMRLARCKDVVHDTVDVLKFRT